MSKVRAFVIRLLRQAAGQDMVEYSLLAGFIAVAAAAVVPTIAGSISTIFSKVGSLTSQAASI